MILEIAIKEGMLSGSETISMLSNWTDSNLKRLSEMRLLQMKNRETILRSLGMLSIRRWKT